MTAAPDRDDAADFPVEPHEFPERGPDSLASIPQRALARVLDTFVIALVPLVVLWGTNGIDVVDDNIAIDAPGWLPLAILAGSAAYEIALVTLRGQTVGKMILGIRVARAGHGGNPLPNQATVRWLVPNVAGVIPVAEIAAIAVLVIYLSAAGHRLRQGFHDRAAGTVVVRTR
jgi:uncharacterized RDD family membrane protein YckC